MRNQLILSVGSNKLQFADHSGHVPARDDFPIRVAHAAEYIGTASNHVYTAIGLNFEVEAKSAGEELPSQALLQRFVKEEALKGTGYDAVGASARLWYAAHDRIHDLRIEPRGNLYDARTYYAGLSTQIVLEGVLPSPEWLSHLLKEVYDDFHRGLDNCSRFKGKLTAMMQVLNSNTELSGTNQEEQLNPGHLFRSRITPAKLDVSVERAPRPQPRTSCVWPDGLHRTCTPTRRLTKVAEAAPRESCGCFT